MAEIAVAYVSIVPSARGFGTGVRAALNGELGGVGAQIGSRIGDDANKSFGSKVATGIKLGLVGAAVGVAGALGKAVSVTADFDAALSSVQATSGATTGQMELLRAKALQIGKDTSFSATEAVQAIDELSKAGVSTTDILNGAADATVALAAASGVDMPTAAGIASNALNAFGLSAKDLSHVADELAGAANASATDVDSLGQGLSQSAAVAHLAGLSFDDTTVALSELANAGIQGSDAGTSLKTMLQNLNPQSKAARAELKELGIITADGGNKFFDATGKVKSLRDIQEVLSTSTAGLTQQQKSAALQIIFGTDAIRAAAVFSAQGAEGYDKLSTAIGKVSAADVAKTRLDNLKGSVEQLKGSAETLAITVGSGITPALRKLTDGATSALNSIVEKGPAAVAQVQAILAALKSGSEIDLAKALGVSSTSGIVRVLLDTRNTAVQVFDDIREALHRLEPGAAAAGRTLATLAGAALTVANGGFRVLGSALPPIAGALSELFEAIDRHRTAFTVLAAGVGTAVVAFKGLQAASAAASSVQTVVGAFQNAEVRAGGLSGALQQARGGFTTLASEAEGSAKRIGTFGTSLINGAKFGAISLAITGVALGIGALAKHYADAKPPVDAFTAAIQADSGALGENVRAKAAALAYDKGYLTTAQQLGLSTQTVTDAILRQPAAIAAVNSAIQSSVSAYNNLASSNAAARAAGSTDAEIAAHAAQITKQKDAALALGQGLGVLGTALSSDKAKQDAIAQASSSATAQTDRLKVAQSGLNQATTALNGALDTLAGNYDTVGASADSYQRALAGIGQAAKDNGTKLAGNTEAALNNREAFRQAAQAIAAQAKAELDSGASALTVKAHFEANTKALQANAEKAGFNKAEVDKLTGGLKAVPKLIDTKIQQQGAVDVASKAKTVDTNMRNIPTAVRTAIQQSGASGVVGAAQGVTRAAKGIPTSVSTTIRQYGSGPAEGALHGVSAAARAVPTSVTITAHANTAAAEAALIRLQRNAQAAKNAKYEATVRDSGGPLMPGYTTVYNGTGKVEWVRTHEQEMQARQAIAGARPLVVGAANAADGGATGPGRSYTVNSYSSGTPSADELVGKLRQAEALSALAGAGRL